MKTDNKKKFKPLATGSTFEFNKEERKLNRKLHKITQFWTEEEVLSNRYNEVQVWNGSNHQLLFNFKK